MKRNDAEQIGKLIQQYLRQESLESPLNEQRLLDAMLGDSTLYARSDALEASWKFIDPILLHWKEEGSKNLFFYEPGEDGPEETVILGAEKKVCACQRR